MYENVKKTDDRVKVKDTYPLKHPEGLHRQRIITDDIRVCARPVPVMKLQPAQNQAVIQMAPYEDLMNNLQDRADMQDLIVLIRTYIERKNMYEENREEPDANRIETLAGLLSMAFNISHAANVINEKLEVNEENKDLKENLEVLGKFVHVELPPDETMSLDDLSDILEQTRALVETQASSSSESPVKGKDIIRELGLLSVIDKKQEEEKQRLVLMINGGKSAEGSGGSVAAPGGNTAVFKNNWKDVRFIAHTHPIGVDPTTNLELQSSSEFEGDVKAARKEAEDRYEGLKRAEMVRREPNEGQKGATIFYTGDGVLNNSNSRDVYFEGFEVRSDFSIELLNDLDYKKEVTELLLAEQEVFQEKLETLNAFDLEFIEEINTKVRERDAIVAKLQTSLSAEDFIKNEQDLAKFNIDYPQAFKKKDLNNEYEIQFRDKFPEIANRLDEKKAEDEKWKKDVLAKLHKKEEDETPVSVKCDIGDILEMFN